MNILKLSAVSLFLILLLISCGGDFETKTPAPTTQDNEVASQSPTITTSPTPEPTELAQPSPTPSPSPTPKASPTPIYETYYVEEPYEVTQTYYEEKILEYEVIDARVEESSYTSHNMTKLGGKVVYEGDVEHVFPVGYVEVENIDEHLGTFTVHFTVYTLDKTMAELGSFVTTDEEGIKTWGTPYRASKKVEIPSGETVESRFSFGPGNVTMLGAADITDSYWSWDYRVHPPTIQIEKEETVTKYRKVEKTRLVSE